MIEYKGILIKFDKNDNIYYYECELSVIGSSDLNKIKQCIDIDFLLKKFKNNKKK